MTKTKKTASAIVASALAAGMLFPFSACAEDVTLEMEIGYTDNALEQFKGIIDDFTAESGIGVELVTPGSDYETVMKTRMASGDMPDVFITHGWSIGRYKEYLLALNDQEWYQNQGTSIRSVIEDEEGNGYVLCVSQGVNGIEYNADVLAEAEVDPMEIKTMDDFMAACEKIKGIGVDPMFVGGKDYWTIATLMDDFAPVYFTSEGCAYPSTEALKDGNFDWESDGLVYFNVIKDMVNNGYFNEDFITADENQGFEALASGKCAFLTGGLSLSRIKSYNQEANISVMPIPATSEGGKSQYQVGEGSAFGIWKDSEYTEEAKQLLAFLAKPETAARILTLDEQLPALMDTEAADNITYVSFKESEDAYEGNICYDNLFDREYLPSGMWSVLSDAMMEVFMDPTDAGVENAAKLMQENYVEKMEAAE